MPISDLIKQAEQKHLSSLKNILISAVKKDADLIRERASVISELEKICPLEQVRETYERLKIENRDDIEVVRFVEKKKKIPKAIKLAYETAKTKIKSYETLDSCLNRIKTELEPQSIVSTNDYLAFVLPVYIADKVPNQRNLSHDLYSDLSVWFNDQVQKLKDGNITLDDVSTTEKDGLIMLMARPKKETASVKKSLKNFREMLFENLGELDLDRINKANIRFNLYDDQEGYILKEKISKKRFYTPKDIYGKYKINAANLAWLVRKGMIKPEIREDERNYDADVIDEILTKRQGYSIKEAARRWKELEQKLTGKEIPLMNYEARISDLKVRNRINIIETKDTYKVPVKEFDNHLYRMNILYRMDKRRKTKKGIAKGELSELLNLDVESLSNLTSQGALKLNRKGNYELPSVRKFIYTHMYTGSSWVSYK